MDRWPILVFSSFILEGWLILHLLMCSSFIGTVALSYIWWFYCMLACVQLYYRMGGLGGLFSVVLQDGWPRLACVR